jgi:hypothetical protein
MYGIVSSDRDKKAAVVAVLVMILVTLKFGMQSSLCCEIDAGGA